MPQYSGVWSLQQQMQALTSGQWVTDPLFDYTTLLLQGDAGANGAQNNVFYDTSPNQFAITRNGNTTQGTFSPFSLQPGAWGNYFNGSPNYLSVADNAAFDFGTGNFCVEFWFNAPNQTTSYPGIVSSSGFSGAISIRYDNTGYDNKIFVYMNNGGDPVIASNSSIPNNTWAHVAVVRDSTTSLKIYINGVQDATATISASLATDLSVGPLYIGRGFDVDGANAYFTGYISNLRVTKGGAVYTTNFTPSTAPLTTTVPSGTVSLLACQSNRFVDNSVNAFAITVNGTPSVQAFSPFAPQFQYTASVTGGSGYFDGTGDYLSIAHNTNLDIWVGDFTIECFLYSNANQANYTGICSKGGTGGSIGNGWQFVFLNNALNVEVSAGTFFTNTTVVPNLAWTHCALVKTGTTVSIFQNGSRVATVTGSSTSYSNTANSFLIGIERNSSLPFNGFMSGLRVIKGNGPYNAANTTITVPTSPLTAITNTQLLLNFTNAGITDATAKNVLETVGNAQVSTSVVKYGSGSMYFDGTGDRLVAPASQNTAFRTGDFTIEFWAYPTSSSVTYRSFIDTRSGSVSTGISIWQYGLALEIFGSAQQFTAASALTINTWQHVAVVRLGTTVRVFVNGTQIGSSYTNSSDMTDTRLVIADDNTSTYPYIGYLDDFRITKGIARYTQNFIPPSVALPRQ